MPELRRSNGLSQICFDWRRQATELVAWFDEFVELKYLPQQPHVSMDHFEEFVAQAKKIIAFRSLSTQLIAHIVIRFPSPSISLQPIDDFVRYFTNLFNNPPTEMDHALDRLMTLKSKANLVVESILETLFAAPVESVPPSLATYATNEGTSADPEPVPLTPAEMVILEALATAKTRLPKWGLADAISRLNKDIAGESTVRNYAPKLRKRGLIDNVQPGGYGITPEGRSRWEAAKSIDSL
jgi:hypothetical protein